MDKVTELREVAINVLREVAINVMRNMDVPSYPELVDSLIVAAREEGADQGARKERRRLKASRVVGYDRTEPPYSGQLCYCIPYKAFSPRPASVLAPKEKK